MKKSLLAAAASMLGLAFVLSPMAEAFTSAIAADTKEAEAAKAFISYLKTPAAAAVIKAKGMEPG